MVVPVVAVVEATLESLGDADADTDADPDVDTDTEEDDLLRSSVWLFGELVS